MIQPSALLRNASAGSMMASIDYGAAPGKILIYSGARPVNCGAVIPSNSLLISFTLTKPCGSVGGTILSINPPAAKHVVISGQASFLRITDSYDSVILDIDAQHIGMNVNMLAGKYTGFDYIRIDVGQ